MAGRRTFQWCWVGMGLLCAQGILGVGCEPQEVKLHQAAREGDTDLLVGLLDRGQYVNVRGPGQFTPLHYAAANGRSASADVLLKRGADPNARDIAGRTPLHHAVRGGHAHVVKLLLESRANVSARMRDGSTALHTAAFHGKADVAKLLLDAGADADAAAKACKATALHEAALRGHAGVVDVLLGAGANANVATDKGVTPLHDAARRGREQIARKLIARGAEVTATDASGATPLHYTADASVVSPTDPQRLERLKYVGFLVIPGSEADRRDMYGGVKATVAGPGHVAVARVLLEAGAKVNAEDIAGQTALDCAVRRKLDILVKTLRGKGGKPGSGSTGKDQ